jgi:hypothetical protein
VAGPMKHPESVFELRDPVVVADGLGTLEGEFGGVKHRETAVVNPESAKAFAMASATPKLFV